MRALKCIILIILALPINVVFADTPLDKWMSTTVLIQNEWNNTGTGFFVFNGIKSVNDNNIKVFLVTNKHNINKDIAIREKAKVLTLYLNVEGIDNNMHVEKRIINLTEKGKRKWGEHRNPNVDVLVIDVTELFGANNRIAHGVVGYDTFIKYNKAGKEEDKVGFRVGDDVFIIGYPQGRTQTTSFRPLATHGGTVLPILRQGMISTPIDGQVDGLPAFLIDGGVIPGSSGSPVIVRQRVNIYMDKGQPTIGSVSHAFLLGIVASTSYVPVESNLGIFLNLTNLAMAFNTDSIVEAIKNYSNDNEPK